MAAEPLGERADVEARQVQAGTPGVCSNTANDLRIEYSPLRITTKMIGSRCWAAVQMACTEYWNDPSPMVATTVRLTPRARSPSATPTAPGTPQPMPPLAVAKNDAGRVVGRNRSCWACVEVDSVTSGESAGLTARNVAQTASADSGAEPVRSTSSVVACLAGTCRSLRSSTRSTSCSRVSNASPIRLSPTGAVAASPWVGGDLQQFGALGQILAGDPGVVPEDLRADHDHQVVTSQRLADTADGHRQLPLEQAVILGE